MSILGLIFAGSKRKRDKCAICGAELGLLNKVKLSDGLICTYCYNKKSKIISVNPGRITVESFRKHLEDREKNKETIVKYNFSKEISGNNAILIDVENRAFIFKKQKYFSPFGNDYSDNPDVFFIRNITKIVPRIQEDETEITYTDSNDNYNCFKPSVYSITYSFVIDIELHNSLISKFCIILDKASDPSNSFKEHYVFDSNSLIVNKYDEKIGFRSCMDFLGRRNNRVSVLESDEYRECEKKLNETVDYLLSLHPDPDSVVTAHVESKSIKNDHWISSAHACQIAFYGFAISLTSVFCCCGFLSPISLILSLIGLFSTRKQDIRAKVYSIIGIILSIIQIVIIIVFFVTNTTTS